MPAFELVTIVITVVALSLSAIPYFRTGRVLNELGRHGQAWFDHAEDLDAAHRPDDDARDDPIPRRRLRGRPQ